MKVGLLGAGKMGGVHGRQYAQMPDIEIMAYDTDPEPLSALVNETGATACGSADELIADADFVDVCLPTDRHLSHVMAAIKAGKTTLTEKPMGRTLAECRQMIEASESTGVTLGVAHVVRTFPEHALAHKQVLEGAIGRVASVRMRRGGTAPYGSEGWFQDFDRSGGVFLDLAVHEFDWLLWTLGPCTLVCANSVTLGKRVAGAEFEGDYGTATLSFACGAIAHVEATWLDPGGFRTVLEVSGSDGCIEFDSRMEPVLRSNTGSGTKTESHTAPCDDPYRLELAAFVECVRTGGPPPVTAREGAAAVAVAEAAIMSAQTGQPVVPEAV